MHGERAQKVPEMIVLHQLSPLPGTLPGHRVPLPHGQDVRPLQDLRAVLGGQLSSEGLALSLSTDMRPLIPWYGVRNDLFLSHGPIAKEKCRLEFHLA